MKKTQFISTFGQITIELLILVKILLSSLSSLPPDKSNTNKTINLY